MKTIWHDIRYGLRQLRASPGFTAVAVLSLALGIGANTAIYSMINGILLKSLPVRNPHELRLIHWTCHKKPHLGKYGEFAGDYGWSKYHGWFHCGSFSYPAYRDFVEQAEGFSDVFAFSYGTYPVTISARGAVSKANGQMVSGNFFKGYGASVLIGRPIAPEDDQPDADPVTVITYDLWERVFGLDPNALGRPLALKDAVFTVVGVLPRRYVGPEAGGRRTDFYVPMAAQSLLIPDEEWLASDDTWWLQIMGRLAPGANEVRLQTSLERLFGNALRRTEAGATIDQPGILLQEGRHGVVMGREEIAEPLWFLQGVVGLVLLIACTNLAGLLLARGAGRQQEMAVRAAMGAGWWRLTRQSLTESMVLSLAGACLGLAISLWIKAGLRDFVIDPSSNQHFNLRIDASVLMFALTVGVITTLLFGLLPALRAGSTNPSAGLKDGGTCGAPRLRLGKVLVTAQVGMSVLLVVVAGLLCRTLINLCQTDLGFDTENILLVNIQPLESLSEVENLRQFHPTMRQRIAAIPGVRSVAISNWTLLRGAMRSPDISIPARPDAEHREAEELVISGKYFATMGINLLAGRDFDDRDTRESQPVVIVNAEFGRLFFPDESPIGQFITAYDQQYQIIGSCSDHSYGGIRRGVRPVLYLPYSQKWEPDLTYAIRSVLPPLSLVPAVRKVVAQVDRNLPLEGITTQKLAIKKSLAQERLFASLCGSFAVLVVLLSCIGLYGIMAYNVARRTGEMGIRKALGARPADVAWPVLRGALMLTIIGVAIGLPIALALARWMRSVFFGIGPHDPVTMIGTVGMMIAVAVLAAWIPARRAARIDPMAALRYE